jgi:O-succinylbenzoic acid--CoA ligase
MPLGHVGGLSVVLRCLEARVPIVVSPWTGALGPLLDDVDRHQATLLSLVPTMLARIFEERPSYRFPPHVRAVLLGGDAASPSLLAAATARGIPVLTTYGMTEACSQIATLSPGEAPTPENGVGRPLPGTELRFVGGEIQVRGPTLFTRYVPVGRFPTPFLDDGWFATGDLGRLDEHGRLHVTGRKSDLIITGGENVDPREVEIALEACAGVRAACVFPISDEKWGQLVAAAVIVEGHETGATVFAEVKARLAKHKWPRQIAIVSELVYNGTGKLDRRRTRDVVASSLVDVR